MSTRPRAEIMRDLKAVLAELDFAMNGPEPTSDISPKLQQALDQTRHTRATMPSTAEQPIKSHEDIRQQARANKDYGDIRGDELNQTEKKERLKDYTAVDDPDWPPDSTWLGTGDQRLVE